MRLRRGRCRAEEDIYDQIRAGIRKSPALALSFLHDITDRIEGTATKKVEQTVHRPPEGRFIFTTKEGDPRVAADASRQRGHGRGAGRGADDLGIAAGASVRKARVPGGASRIRARARCASSSERKA
jgi:hypothetical protein